MPRPPTEYARLLGDRPRPPRDPRPRRGRPRARGSARAAIHRRWAPPPGWGTRTGSSPLGDAYLELVAVANPEEARDSAFGQWVARSGRHLLRPLGWAVRPVDLDDVARRQGLAVTPGARVTPTGERLAWRTAGVDRAAAEPSLPFLIEWEPGYRFPGSDDTNAQARLVRLVLRAIPRASPPRSEATSFHWRCGSARRPWSPSPCVRRQGRQSWRHSVKA